MIDYFINDIKSDYFINDIKSSLVKVNSDLVSLYSRRRNVSAHMLARESQLNASWMNDCTY